MDTLEAIYARRSVKQFDKNHALSTAEEKILLQATIQAPTSFNVQHWRLVVFRDPTLRQHLRNEFAGGQPQLTDASLLVLFTADVKAWAKEPERYWRNAPPDIADQVPRAIGPFHEKLGDQFQRDEAHWSVGMAMQTLMLAAQSLGYQSCPIIGFNIEGVAKLIHLPADHVMGPMVAVGKGIKDPWPKPGQLPLSEIAFENSF
ncbi:MAG: nitroreductase family protein [Candidatus Latescibacteria bacterium]|jgi:nitroreductase|nr:nitroreductase family protein [Candidatus Latescibacterota bacterium]